MVRLSGTESTMGNIEFPEQWERNNEENEEGGGGKVYIRKTMISAYYMYLRHALHSTTSI